MVNPPYETFVDQIIEYKDRALDIIGNSKEVVALLLDDPNVDMDSEEAQSVFDKYLWDYQFVDDTVQEAGAHIMVEASKIEDNGGTIQDFALYVEIAVSKEFVDIDHKKFVGMRGNRIDNLARFIDKQLNGNRDFGIGELKPEDIRPISVPKHFKAVMLTYKPVGFGRRTNGR